MNHRLHSVRAVLSDLLAHAFHAAHVAASALVAVHVGAERGHFQNQFIHAILDFDDAPRERVSAYRAAWFQFQSMSLLHRVAPLFIGLRSKFQFHNSKLSFGSALIRFS